MVGFADKMRQAKAGMVARMGQGDGGQGNQKGG
jgi:hypothetical protein